jgi:hypothetical protein
MLLALERIPEAGDEENTPAPGILNQSSLQHPRSLGVPARKVADPGNLRK